MSIFVKFEADAFFRAAKAMLELPSTADRVMAQAFNIEAEKIMRTAKRLVPVDLGTLRASGFVKTSVAPNGKSSVTLGFGGPAAPYAVHVHENLYAKHRPPTQAKFLQIPFQQAMQGLDERVAKRIQRAAKILAKGGKI